MNTNNFIKRLSNNNCLLLTKDNRLKKNYLSYIEILKDLQKGNKIHLCIWHSAKGHYNLQNVHHNNIKAILSFANVDYIESNDAPHGGQNGNYLQLTQKGKRQFANINFELLK